MKVVCMDTLAHACLPQPKASSHLTVKGFGGLNVQTPPAPKHSRSGSMPKSDESSKELFKKNFKKRTNANLKQAYGSKCHSGA